jgi:hypothetical protein
LDAQRGIVAAAISVFFAIKLESIGYPQAAQMVPLTFEYFLQKIDEKRIRPVCN